MSRSWPLALALVVACDAQADNAKPGADTAKPETSATKPGAPPAKRRFPLVDKQHRPAAAAEIAKTFPAEWHPVVTADFAGMPQEVTLELPAEVAADDRIPRALAIVRDHAAALGVLAARELHYVVDSDMIRIGAGERWSGQIVASFEGRKLTLYGHLWPIAVERLAVPPEAEKLVSPFYGVAGEYLSKCLDCGHKDSHFVLDKHSFSFAAGMALVCTPEGVVSRAAISIERNYRPGSRIPGIEKLPDFVDAHTLAPLRAPELGIYIPGDGAYVAGTTTFGPRVGFDFAGCFE